MEPEGKQAGQDTNGVRHGDGLRMGGLTHSIRPGIPCPDTVLIVVLSNGSYLLVGYPEGAPAAFLTAEDAGPLRQGLDGAFGHRKDILGGKARL